MAKALQHDQAALIAQISTACATNNEPFLTPLDQAAQMQ
jgi:hypothetical protein